VGTQGCEQANTLPTLEQALGAADNDEDADRIFLGPGTYTAKTAPGFDYARTDAPVEIIGAGRQSTVLTSPAGATGNVIFLNGAPGSSIHDLTIKIPAGVATPNYRGLTTTNYARRIDVVESDQQNGTRGVMLVNGGTLVDSTVSMSSPGSATGVWMQMSAASAEPSLVRDSRIDAATGIWADGGGRVERSVITGIGPGLYAQGGHTAVEQSLIRGTMDTSTDVYASPGVTGTTLRLDGDTLVGTGDPTNDGVVAFGGNSAQNVHVDVVNTVIAPRGALVTLANGPGRATIAASYSAYDSAQNSPTTPYQGVTEHDIVNPADLGFVDPGTGNFRLRPGSALVDAGDPDSARGADLDGNLLIADGNGDGTARRDIGAYELSPPAPAGPAPGPVPDKQPPLVSGFRASRTALTYGLSESARVTVTIQRRLAGHRARYGTVGKLSASATGGKNRTRVAARLRRKEARPGRYRAVIVATDAAGNRSKPKTATFRVSR
jgi:hypothetical protein